MLYIFNIKIIPPGNNTGFGTTETSATSNLNNLIRSGGAYQLKLPDDYKLISKTEYWLKKNGNYINVKSFKQFEDVFPKKAPFIKDYVKANKLSFKKPDDVIKLVVYCN
ncbi:MAG: hypothetical protein WKF91_17115 [Segetibacter sp.]